MICSTVRKAAAGDSAVSLVGATGGLEFEVMSDSVEGRQHSFYLGPHPNWEEDRI
ncbi:MAG: hypothetical protein HY898_14365 [Deltaproteobacteria bacterium]|nr:hypothetical protein [Deltaproteobacteria bacterium]